MTDDVAAGGALEQLSRISDEMFEDCLKVMLHKNIEKRKRARRRECANIDISTLLSCNKENVFKYIIYACQVTKLGDEIKLLSVAIFDLIINNLFRESFSYMYHSSDCLKSGGDNLLRLSPPIDESVLYSWLKTDSRPKQRSKMWREVVSILSVNDNVQQQWESVVNYVKLNTERLMIASILLANKLQACHDSSSISYIVRVLNKRNSFTTQDILEAELFALDILHFDLLSVPALYPCMEMFIDAIRRFGVCTFDREALTGLSVEVLLCVIYRQTEVYGDLWAVISASGDYQSSYCNKWEVLVDESLLTCVVVAASAYLYDKHISDEFISKFSQLTMLPENLLADFANIILSRIGAD